MLRFKTVAYYQPMLVKELKDNVVFVDVCEKAQEASLDEQKTLIAKIAVVYKLMGVNNIIRDLIHEIVYLEFGIQYNQLMGFETYLEHLKEYFNAANSMNDYLLRVCGASHPELPKNRSINGIILEYNNMLLLLVKSGFTPEAVEKMDFFKAIKLIETIQLQDNLTFNNAILGQALASGNIKSHDFARELKQFKDL